MGTERKFRAFTCNCCARKHAWKVMLLPEVGGGQCYFCERVFHGHGLYETPFMIIEPESRKRKKSKREVDLL